MRFLVFVCRAALEVEPPGHLAAPNFEASCIYPQDRYSGRGFRSTEVNGLWMSQPQGAAVLPSMRLDGKVALVAGEGSGIGRAAALMDGVERSREPPEFAALRSRGCRLPASLCPISFSQPPPPQGG